MRTISIAKDFSVTTGGRFNRDGPYSGEAFRARFLEPAFNSGDTVVIDLDDVAGLPSSFLEEAFGGLVRAHQGLTSEALFARFQITTTEPDLQPYIGLIRRYVAEASH